MLLAVDVGNSKCEALLLTNEGTVAGWHRGGRMVPNDLGAEGTAQAIADLVRLESNSVDASWVGCAGVDFEDQADDLSHAMAVRGGFGEVFVHNDIDAVLYLSDLRAELRCAVVLGAGMNAVGTLEGRWARFRALGAISGDRGGGGEIGLSAVVAAARSADRRGPYSLLEQAVPAFLGHPNMDCLSRSLSEGSTPSAELLRLAPLVFEKARQGDDVAREIVKCQALEVAAMINSLIVRLQGSGLETGVVAGGSVLRYGRDLLEDLIHEHLSQPIELEFPDLPPVVGAAKALLAERGVARSVDDIGRELLECQ